MVGQEWLDEFIRYEMDLVRSRDGTFNIWHHVEDAVSFCIKRSGEDPIESLSSLACKLGQKTFEFQQCNGGAPLPFTK